MSNTHGILYEAGTAYPSRAPAFTPSCSMGSVLLTVLVFALSYYLSVRFYFPATKCYPCPSFRNFEIKQLSPLFFAMLWDIDLIFGMWVYNDKSQIKVTFRSSPIILGRGIALGLWNLAKYLVVTTLYSLCLEILTWYLVYDCIMISYRSIYLSFRSNDFWPCYGLWTLKFGQIFSCHHFISLWFEILLYFWYESV